MSNPILDNLDRAVQPVVFYSLNLSSASQQRAEGNHMLRNAVTDAVDYGAQVITIAGLGFREPQNMSQQIC